MHPVMSRTQNSHESENNLSLIPKSHCWWKWQMIPPFPYIWLLPQQIDNVIKIGPNNSYTCNGIIHQVTATVFCKKTLSSLPLLQNRKKRKIKTVTAETNKK